MNSSWGVGFVFGGVVGQPLHPPVMSSVMLARQFSKSSWQVGFEVICVMNPSPGEVRVVRQNGHTSGLFHVSLAAMGDGLKYSRINVFYK